MSFILPSIQRYASDRFVIPSGVRGGMKYREEVNPATHGVLDIYNKFLFDSSASELYLIAGNQVGKTLSLILTACYVLSELREDLLIFGPTFQVAQAVAHDVIRSLEYQGITAERGTYQARLSNGVVLTWRGQSDSQRAQVTSRIVLVTEAEKIRQKRTEEAHPIDQIRARVMSFRNGKIFFESTITSETGLMWSAYKNADKVFEFYHRCGECGELFKPDINNLGEDWYACSNCGVVIPIEERRKCIESGGFVDNGGVGRYWGVRYSAFDGLLIDPFRDMVFLRDSSDLNAQRRLYLQYLCEPPRLIFVSPEDPITTEYRRGVVEPGDYWCIGVDVGVSVAHYVLLAYTPGSDFIRIADFGKCRGSLQAQVDTLKGILSSLDPERGVLLFDYGFNGQHMLRLWNKAGVKQLVLPIRGMATRSFVIDPANDIRYGDWWRYRRMVRSGSYTIQIDGTAGKDAVFGLLYTSRLRMFSNDGSDITVRQFSDSLCRSERPIEENGERRYEKVGVSNHYFDATVYALAGLLFVGAPIDLTALPRIESASMVKASETPTVEIQGNLIVDENHRRRSLRIGGNVKREIIL